VRSAATLQRINRGLALLMLLVVGWSVWQSGLLN
jgi:hypothetical protein